MGGLGGEDQSLRQEGRMEGGLGSDGGTSCRKPPSLPPPWEIFTTRRPAP